MNNKQILFSYRLSSKFWEVFTTQEQYAMYIYFSSVIDITAINFQTAQAQIYQQFSFLLEEI